MLIQPKPYLDKFKLRHHAYGTEQRRNMSKLILEHGTPLPKPIEYSDIDQTMYDWVVKHIDVAYDGKKLPTYKLYSTQRLSEYIQSWDKQDEVGNPIINFLTITRDLNPQKGENQGNYFNIPGHKNFAMFYVPVLQENGTEAYDKYTMKQPTQINFLYTVSIVSNKMEIINEVNELMHYEFNAITCYISPNGHPMSMTLEDVSDESEYTINDRKYYSQSYKIKVKGYIIRKEDYKVERIPSRIVISSHDSDASGIVNRRGKNRREDEKVVFFEGFELDDEIKKRIASGDIKHCEVIQIKDKQRPSEVAEEIPDTTTACNPNPSPYYNKIMKIIMNFDDCTTELSFAIDKDMILTSIETENVHDFRVIANDEALDLECELKFYKDDEITVRITRDDLFKTSKVTLIGYDPYVAFDSRNIPESALDEPKDEEHILINFKEEDTNGL
jgi:hypothetical protein